MQVIEVQDFSPQKFVHSVSPKPKQGNEIDDCIKIEDFEEESKDITGQSDSITQTWWTRRMRFLLDL